MNLGGAIWPLIHALTVGLIVTLLVLALQNRLYILHLHDLLRRRGPDAEWCVNAEKLNPGWQCGTSFPVWDGNTP